MIFRHIYRKWKEKFFEENMQAFRAGRAEKNPSQFWYEGELGFFDFYIIPLAEQWVLRFNISLGVFGIMHRSSLLFPRMDFSNPGPNPNLLSSLFRSLFADFSQSVLQQKYFLGFRLVWIQQAMLL